MLANAKNRWTAQSAALSVVTLTVLSALAWSDWYFGVNWNPSVAYPTLMLSCWWIRSRRFLWILTGAMIAMTLLVLGIETHPDHRSIIHRILSLLAMLVTAAVFDHLIKSWSTLQSAWEQVDSRGQDLQLANEELSAREHEIATQNEELRSQTEELERQSEELRVANEELARRERSLEALLRLSRSLTAEMSRSDTLDRICQALSELISGPDLGVGVKLREGDFLRLLCHYGFGPKGPKIERLPFAQSFGRLVLERNHSGYLEDIALRPDLIIPQPAEGEPFRSILSAPLRVNGRAIGTLEVYSRQRRTWSDEQIGIVESIAAQTSVSLQAAELFDRVDQERRRFQAIFRTLPIGVCVYDAASGKTMNNPEAVLLLGQPAETTLDERRSAKYRVVRHGVEVPFEQFPLLRSLSGEEVHGEELDLVFPARRRSLLVSAAPVRSADGRIEGSISAFTDISTLKELQSELDSRRREAEEQSVRKSRFLAQVSHDIRNPANTISLLAELLYRTAAQHDGASEVASIAGDLRKNALSLVDLVSDVLDLTRFDSGRIELEETEFSLTDMLTEECRGYREMASEKNLDFECILPPGNMIVRTDRVKLSRVLGNLLSNALKFTETGSVKLTVCTVGHEGQAQELELSVVDTGPGVPKEFQDRIFDEFFQVRKNSGSNRGAGLGLAICKRLINAMGGNIWVESEPGQGSAFCVRLPNCALVRM